MKPTYKIGDAVGVKDAPQGAVLGHVVEVLTDGRYTRYRIRGTDACEYVRPTSLLNDCRPEALARIEAERKRRAAHFAANRVEKLARTTIPAKDVPTYGGFFRKVGGEYVHMRISESSIRHFKLDESKVYGVTFSGNVSVLDPEKPVVLCTVEGLVANVTGNEAWEDAVGVTSRRENDLLEARTLITKALATLESTGGHTVGTLSDLRAAVERLGP